MISYYIIDMNNGKYRLGKVNGKMVTLLPWPLFRLLPKTSNEIINIDYFDVVMEANPNSLGIF